MRTRSQARNRNRRQQQLTTVIVEEPEFPMADNRTMAQMLQAPIEGYEDAIVVPPINANNFELKQPLINLVQSNKFTGRQDPHNHLRFFNKVTSTFRHPEVSRIAVLFLAIVDDPTSTEVDEVIMTEGELLSESLLNTPLKAQARRTSGYRGVKQEKFESSHHHHLFPSPIELGPRNMSNSDELRHTDNTTLVPPRLPDTLPQVYHMRRPTLGLLIFPFVPSFTLTLRRTVRISIPPIKPNLAERARISAINLDDYQFDPLTPPPSPSSPFTMAAYQQMISEMDPLAETGQNSVPVPEIALTACITRLRGQLHTILKDMDRYPNACLEELESFMTLWDVKPRVKESLLETLSVDELITQLRQ
ncbi:hypothetical protein Tco_0503105, partial [Tanacetum coccineum]